MIISRLIVVDDPLLNALTGHIQCNVNDPILTPVSYTHLDVYKRQHVHFLSGCRHIPVRSSAGNPALHQFHQTSYAYDQWPVSYTHLDVYKRQTLEEAKKILAKARKEKLPIVDKDFNLKGLITRCV